MSNSNSAGRMIKHSSIYAMSNISRQLVGFIMLPVYTQLLSPADYGVVGLLAFTISLVDIVFGARLIQAIPKFYHGESDKTKRNIIISTALILTSAISAITTFTIIWFSDLSSELVFGSSDLSIVLAIYATLILTQAIENYGLLFIRLRNKPWLFLAFSLSKLFVQLGLNIWLVVYLEMGVMGIAISAAISAGGFALILLFYTLFHTKVHWCRYIAKRLVIFCWPLWLAAFAGLYIGSANRYYMRIYGSLDDIGLYELAAKLSSVIVLLIWRPINQYWQTERFKYYDSNKPASKIYQSVFLAMGTLLILAGLGISIFSAPLIQVMASPEFFAAAAIVPFLVLAAILSSFVRFMNFSQLATENTKWISLNNYFVAIIATIYFLLLIPSYSYIGAAIAYLLAVFTQLILTVRASRRHYDMKVKFLPVIYMILISAGGYFIANHGIKINSIVLDITFKAVIYICITLLIILIMWQYSEDKSYLRSTVERILRRSPKSATDTQ